MDRKSILSQIGAVLIVVVLLVQMLPSVAFAEITGTYPDEHGTYTYIDNGDGTATITQFTYGYLGELNIPGTIGESDELIVTKIGDNAFLYTSLTGVSIPASVKEIGNNAFASSSLTGVTIPEGVISIGNYAFSDSHLLSLTIPASVTNIGNCAFLSNDLTSVTIRNRTVTIAGDAFVANQASPADLKIYGYTGSTAQVYAQNCGHTFVPLDEEDGGSGGEKLVVVDGCTYTYSDNGDGTATITDFAPGDGDPTEIIIPGSFDDLTVSAIGDYAFDECGLTGVAIPEGLKSIGEWAFYSNRLTAVTIPSSVTGIGAYAFAENAALTDVTIENSEVIIGENVFGGHDLDLTIQGYVDSTTSEYVLENGHIFAALGGIEATDEEGNIYTYIENEEGKATVIGFKAGVSKNIEMPQSINGLIISDIYHFALAKCGLESMIIPADVENIGLAAFAFNQLAVVSIQGSTTNVGDAAFFGNPADLAIYGVPGSPAEIYAEENGFTFIALGSFAEGSGNGTLANSALLVETAEQLSNVRNYPEKCIKLVGNIEMTEYLAEGGEGYNEGKGWEPICTQDEPFSGVFDGNGYSISGLNITRSGEYELGLFGAVGREAVVKNVQLDNVNITGDIVVGGLAGSNGGTVIGCHVTGSVNGSSIVGGLVGVNIKGSSVITECSASGSVEGESQTGGLAGRNDTDGLISKCKASASVRGVEDGTGGLTGYNKGTIELSYSDGSVVGSSDTGGLVGNNSGTLDSSYSAGRVMGDSNIGGLVGSNGEMASITGAYYDSDIAGVEHNEAGTPLSTVEMKQQASFVGWQFDSIWAIREGVTYPYLQWEDSPIGPTFTLTYTAGSNGSISGTAVQYVNYGENGTAVTAVPNSGCHFGGWSDGVFTATRTDTHVTADLNVTATFVRNSSSGRRDGDTHTTRTEEGANGRTLIVTLNEDKLAKILEAFPDKSNTPDSPSVISVPVSTEADMVIGELNGQMVKDMENKNVVIEIKTNLATYTIPAEQVNIEDVSAKLGTQIELKDIIVQIEISRLLKETVEAALNSAKAEGYTIVVPPIEFVVKCLHDDKTVEVSRFNSYVEKTVAIPDDVDPAKITTGVVVDPDGTVRHVPTKIIVIDGKYYARINSLTNSAYSVIWHPVEFKDAEKHWAKQAINDMGSRLIISGTGNDLFAPDRDVTRAEFAAIVVRALGLKPGTGTIHFNDVQHTDGNSSDVITAAEYKIISGYGNGLFRPNDKITREQAMAMIVRAMDITGLNSEIKDGDVSLLHANYSDLGDVSDYAKTSLAVGLKTGIMTGRSKDTIAPKNNITRAEVAVIIQRLLQKSNLI